MESNYIVALELAGTQVRGILASTPTNGISSIPTIMQIATEDKADCVTHGRVTNIVTAKRLTEQVLEKIENNAELNGARVNGVYVGIGGRSLASEHTSVTIDLPTEMEIKADIMQSLYEQAAKKGSAERKVLQVIPRKFYVDNQMMPDPVGALGRKLKGEFTLVTCNSVNKRNLDMVFERIGIPVYGYMVTQLLLADAVLSEEEKQLGCALVDIGAQTTTIAIYKDRALQYIATLPMGSHNMTRDISTCLNVTIEKAEALKLQVGDAMPIQSRSTDDTTRVNNYIEARANELVANISANLTYAKLSSAALPEGFILTGNGARLKNLDNLLASQTKMRTRHAIVPASVNISDSAINPSEYLSIIALALGISKMSHEDCITLTHSPVMATPVTVEQPTYEPARHQTDERATTTTYRQPDEETLLADDPLDSPVKQKNDREEQSGNNGGNGNNGGRRGQRLIDKLKGGITKLISGSNDEIDGDTML